MVTAGNVEAPDLRKRQVVEMEMDEIVLIRFLGYGFDEIEVMGERRKQLAAFESKGPFANGSQAWRWSGSRHLRKALRHGPLLTSSSVRYETTRSVPP